MIKEYFWVAAIGILLNATLIIVDAAGFLPLNPGLFGLTFLIVFLLALYRPIWIFWLFIISLPLESVIISSPSIPLSFRPFQVIGLMLFLATASLIFYDRSKNNKSWSELIKFNKDKFLSVGDVAVLVLCGLSFVSLFKSLNFGVTLKQNFVLLFFVMLYFLSKFYLRKKQNQFEALWFFVATSLPILIFGIYQSLAFKVGWLDFQVFAERANGTFTEPDWFGIYLVFLGAIIYWLKLQMFRTKNSTMIAQWELRKVGQWVANFYLLLIFVVLILTVARSAWVGFLALTIVYFIILIWQKIILKLRNFNLENYFRETLTIGSIYFSAIILVILFGLSNFNLTNRAASSVSGLQEITISCPAGIEAPAEISGVEELDNYGCKHINLEDINGEIISGNNIQKVLRPDPNVEIRKNIYQTTWKEIKNNFWIGQGLGSSSEVLGTDSYGHGLNASNIFLEVWFSWGFLGLIVFAFLLLCPGFTALRNFSSKSSKLGLSFFVVLTMTALIIPNLFNAGIFLSLFWVWLALINS